MNKQKNIFGLPVSRSFQKKLAAILFIFQFLFFAVSAQSPVLTYARYVIDTLTSPVMDGRGYVDSGEWKAATFIRNEFREDSLLKFKGSYFQAFTLNTNEFPDDAEVSIGNQSLVPGKDFLVQAFSGSANGTFSLYKIEKDSTDTAMASVAKLIKPLMKNKGEHGSKVVLAFQRNQFSKQQYQYLMQEIMGNACFGAAGCVEFTKEKLTWDASQEQSPFCSLLIKGDLPSEKKCDHHFGH